MKKILLVLLFLLSVHFALAAPIPYLIESTTVDYYSNGTIEGFTGIGYVEVDVGNTDDVLQFLRLNLSKKGETNLQSKESYRAVAASPNVGDRTRMYISTDNSAQDVSYNTTNSSRAFIKLELDYENLLGGSDISANDTNYFIFNLTLNFTANLSKINLTLQLARDTYNTADSMNITGATATQGIVVINDTDSDNYYDTLIWNGSLNNETAVISFNASIRAEVNFNETVMYVNLDPSYGVVSLATTNSTMTGINFTSLFSRGPIRQGIDLLDFGNGNWQIRGFLKNIADNLNYTSIGWDLYEINDLQNPVLSSTRRDVMQPNSIIYTDFYTETTTKPYYTTAFNWSVNWGSPVYQSSTRGRLILPILYELIIWVDKTVSTISNTLDGRTLKIADLVRHLGQSNIKVNSVSINSIIPNQSSNNWQVVDVGVYYVNASGTYDITSGVNITTSDPGSLTQGYVLLNITNITSVLNHTLKLNEDIRLNYTISSAVSSVDQNFTFDSISIMITESGTPVTSNPSDTTNISGIIAPVVPPVTPPIGGGRGGIPTALKIEIIKEVADISLIEEDVAKVVIVDRIRDNGLRGADDINAFIYTPFTTELDVSSISLEIYDSESDNWEELKRDIDYVLEDEGVVNIGDRKYNGNLIKKIDGEWHLHNDDEVKISYKVKLPFGTHHILTRVSGYDDYNKKTVFEDSYTPIRVVEGGPRLIPLEIKETDFEQMESLVGRAVTWVKTIEVYNPNSADATETFNTLIFPDALNAYITEEGIRKQTELRRKGNTLIVGWEDKIRALGTELYVLKVTTPPVIEVERDIGILQANKTTAIFIANSTIENTALEDYADIYYPLPVASEKIISVEYDGKKVNYTRGFSIPLIKTEERKKVVVVYKERIPTLAIFIDKDFYRCSDTELNFTAFIIPDEESKNYYLELEVVSSSKDNVFADLNLIKELRAGEEFKISKLLKLNFIQTGEHKLIARLRKDFVTLLTGYNIFNVEQEGVTYCVLPKRINIVLLILLILIIIVVVSISRYWITNSRYRRRERRGRLKDRHLVPGLRSLVKRLVRKKKK